MLLATPAANRSRACVSCWAASSRDARRDLQLLAGRLQVEERGPDVVVDAGLQVVGFGAPAAQLGVGLEQPAARPAALKIGTFTAPATA